MKVWQTICFGLLLSCQWANDGEPTLEGREEVSRSSAALTSSSQHIIRKRTAIIRNTLAKALKLDPDGMCLELGKLPCANVVHQSNLGGMAAYTQSQYRYQEDINITAPIALERLTLSACTQRAQIDLLNPKQAVIYKDLNLSADGRLVLDANIDEAGRRLIERGFFRRANDQELAALKQLYVDIYDHQPQGAAINWMILACFTVMTSVEAVFY